jgi:hypothetical protein
LKHLVIGNSVTSEDSLPQVPVNIRPFGREDYSHIPLAFLDDCVRKTSKGVTDLLEAVYLKPENKNISIPSRKKRIARVFNGSRWVFADLDLVIQQLIDDTYNRLEERFTAGEFRMREYNSRAVNSFHEAMMSKTHGIKAPFVAQLKTHVYFLLLNL